MVKLYLFEKRHFLTPPQWNVDNLSHSSMLFMLSTDLTEPLVFFMKFKTKKDEIIKTKIITDLI